MTVDEDKRLAAERALDLIHDGMCIGLGTGSTAAHFVHGLSRRVAAGLRVGVVPTSEATARLARRLGLRLVEDMVTRIDVAIDGADEISPALDLIKGRGGAMLREKVVAAAADRFVVIADGSKLVTRLGSGPLPVEIARFEWRRTARCLDRLGRWVLRGGESTPFVTDNGNLVLDLEIPGGIDHPPGLAAALEAVPGVVAHGLFLGMAAGAIIASNGKLRLQGNPGLEPEASP